MRFIRAYILAATGEIVNVSEQEHPFDTFGILVVDAPDALQLHELGLAEHFDPVDVASGKPCSPSRHLFQRLEHVADAPAEVRGAARFRARPGHENSIPAFHDVPTTVDGIKALARAKGPTAIPERVAHWLEFMGSLADHEMDAMGLPRLTYARALEFDAMRARRDPSHGPRAEVFKRRIRERVARRAHGL